jgi:hypothetical protein
MLVMLRKQHEVVPQSSGTVMVWRQTCRRMVQTCYVFTYWNELSNAICGTDITAKGLPNVQNFNSKQNCKCITLNDQYYNAIYFVDSFLRQACKPRISCNKQFITIKILDVIDCPVFYLKTRRFWTWFCLRLQVGPIEAARLCLRTLATAPIGFMKPTQHKSPKRVYISTTWIFTHIGPNFYIQALFQEQKIVKNKSTFPSLLRKFL